MPEYVSSKGGGQSAKGARQVLKTQNVMRDMGSTFDTHRVAQPDIYIYIYVTHAMISSYVIQERIREILNMLIATKVD